MRRPREEHASRAARIRSGPAALRGGALLALALASACARAEPAWRADLAAHPSAQRRELAAAALADAREPAAAAEALAAALADPSGAVRSRAARSLASLPAEALGAWLASAAAEELPGEAREGLAAALLAAGPAAGDALERELERAATPARVLALAALALGEEPRARAAERVLALAREPEPLAEPERLALVELVRTLAPGDEGLPALHALARCEGCGASRDEALAVLVRRIADALEHAPTERLAALAAALGGERELACRLAEGLASARKGTPLAALRAWWLALARLEPVLEEARASLADGTRAARVLDTLALDARAAAQATRLERALADPEPAVRAAALLRLAEASASVPALSSSRPAAEELLRDPSPLVRRAAHHAAARLGAAR